MYWHIAATGLKLCVGLTSVLVLLFAGCSKEDRPALSPVPTTTIASPTTTMPTTTVPPSPTTTVPEVPPEVPVIGATPDGRPIVVGQAPRSELEQGGPPPHPEEIDPDGPEGPRTVEPEGIAPHQDNAQKGAR